MSTILRQKTTNVLKVTMTAVSFIHFIGPRTKHPDMLNVYIVYLHNLKMFLSVIHFFLMQIWLLLIKNGVHLADIFSSCEHIPPFGMQLQVYFRPYTVHKRLVCIIHNILTIGIGPQILIFTLNITCNFDLEMGQILYTKSNNNLFKKGGGMFLYFVMPTNFL